MTSAELIRLWPAAGVRVRSGDLELRWIDDDLLVLGADHVTSGAFDDNVRSNAVSRKVGYEFDGIARVAREGAAGTVNRYRMSRERWLAVRERHAELLGAPVELEGVEALRAQLDADADRAGAGEASVS